MLNQCKQKFRSEEELHDVMRVNHCDDKIIVATSYLSLSFHYLKYFAFN